MAARCSCDARESLLEPFPPESADPAKGSEPSFRRSGADPPSSHPMGADLSAVAMFRAVPLDDLHPSVAMTRRSAGLRGRNAFRWRCDGHLLPFRRAFHGEGGRGSTRDHLAHFVEVFRPDKSLVLNRAVPSFAGSELFVLQFRVRAHSA